MSSKNWFILSEGEVKGPLEPEEIEARIAQSKDPQIWGRGHSEWMTAARWRQHIRDNPPMKAPQEDSNKLWTYRVDGQARPPMKYPDMIKQLKLLKDFSAVDIMTENGSWKEIFGVQQVVDDIGISRRSHPRVPIVGTLKCQWDKGPFTCRVISISEGGLGVNDAVNLKIGDRFQANLSSPNLYIVIDTTCEVVYVGAEGYAGLRFVNLPMDATSSIIEYVNKFATA